MRRILLTAALVGLLSSARVAAGEAQEDLRSRWLGAWVILTSPVTSDCAGGFTHNRVNGRLVLGGGVRAFEPGEIGQVTGLDLKRSRVDVLVSLEEDVLLPYSDGPFQLYRAARCGVELEVEAPRPMVKQRDVDRVEELILQVVERHASRASAFASAAWNRREREAYPPDYERTLAEHAVWQAESTNAAIAARIQEAVVDARGVLARVSIEKPGYGESFAHGVEVMNARRFEDCGGVLAGSFDAWAAKPPEGSHAEGFHDGQLLAYSVRIADWLPRCYVPVPQIPAEAPVAAAAP